MFKKNINWLVLVLVGCVSIYVQNKTTSNIKTALISGIVFILLGIFKFIYPQKKLLWLNIDRENLFISGLAYAVLAWFGLIVFAGVVGL